jgi:hypothetical protein
MDTTTGIVSVGALVVAGKWAAGEQLNIKIAIGVGVLAVALAVMDAFNPDLAGKFVIAVLFLAAVKYLPPLVQKLGLGGS